MPSGRKREDVLITVMTYPHPSTSYDELICTAGITRDCKWVRLYPVDYRYRPASQQFRKYQWVQVELRRSEKDRRKESFKPTLDSISLGIRLGAEKQWSERRKMIDRLEHRTVNELQSLYDQDRTSLGVVRPTRILDLEVSPAERKWKPKHENIFNQLRLFGEPIKPLRKIPYEFRYVFECEGSRSPHRSLVTDWELGVLYLKEADRLGSEEAAADSVKKKFLDEMCDRSRDTRFFMGTVFPYNTWIVVGVFWPPAEYQPELF